MRKYIKIVGVLVFFLSLTVLASPRMAVAETDLFNDACSTSSSASSSSLCEDTKNSDGKNPISGSSGILYRVTQFMVWLVGASSIIVVIIGGIKYILANGDSSSIANAKETIIYALVGLLIAISGQGIITFVIRKL